MLVGAETRRPRWPSCRSPEYQTSFESVLPFGSGEVQNRFSRWRLYSHIGLLIGMILATFTLQITPKLLTRFPVSCPFSSVEKKVREKSRSATITNRSPSQTPRGRGNRQIQTSTNRTNVRKALRLALSPPNEVIAILKGLKNTRTK